MGMKNANGRGSAGADSHGVLRSLCARSFTKTLFIALNAFRRAQGPPRPSPPRRGEGGCHGSVIAGAGDEEQGRAAAPRPSYRPRPSPSAAPAGSGEAPRRLPPGCVGAGRGRESGRKEPAPAAGAAREPPTADLRADGRPGPSPRGEVPRPLPGVRHPRPFPRACPLENARLLRTAFRKCPRL